jgi:hypothetical protein
MMFQRSSGEQMKLLEQEEIAVLHRSDADRRQKGWDAHRARRFAISVFIGFHLVAIACWCVPVDSPLVPVCRNLVRPYFVWAGLFQSWDMFAPVPKGANIYLEATVVHRDGSRTTWAYPRMEQMSLREKLFKERYRKFADMLQRDELDDLLPDVARHIARLNSDSQNPVKTVILIQRLSFIVPRPDGSFVPEPWESHILLGYGLRAEDLK